MVWLSAGAPKRPSASATPQMRPNMQNPLTAEPADLIGRMAACQGSNRRRRQAPDRAGRAHGVDQQARNRHRSDATWCRRDRARDLGGFRESHVADDSVLAIWPADAIDPDIDHGRARPD